LADLREAADVIANGTRQLETAASSSVSGKVR
jgi:hypothetical protein